MAANTKKKGAVIRKKKARRNVAKGIAHIHSTFNNTIVTISDEAGNVISWSSAGAQGYKGSRSQLLMLHSYALKQLVKRLFNRV